MFGVRLGECARQEILWRVWRRDCVLTRPFARVRAISDQRMDSESGSGGLIGGIRQDLSALDFARSTKIRPNFAFTDPFFFRAVSPPRSRSGSNDRAANPARAFETYGRLR